MNPKALRRTVLWVLLAVFGCSTGSSSSGCGGSCGGSSGCASIPGGFPTAQRTSNAINAELSAQGITYFEQNLSTLIGAIESSGLTIDVPCTNATQTINTGIPLVGTITIPVYACEVTNAGSCVPADNLPANRPAGSNGVPECDAQATIVSTTITPTTASDGSVNIAVVLSMNLHTGNIPVAVDVPDPVFGGNLCTIGCGIAYNANAIPISVTLNMKVDPNWGDILAIDVGGIDLSSIINTNDLSIADTGGGVCSGLCSLLDLSFIKSALFSLVQGTLNTTIDGVIDSLRCQKCDTTQWSTNGGCPTSPVNPALVSTCDSASKLCYVDKSTDVCAPTPLGLQGRVNAGALLSSFGGPPNATLDIYDVAGGLLTSGAPTTYVDSAGGVVVGVMGGTNSPFPATCVPPATPPSIATPDKLDFVAAAMESGLPPIPSYDMGIGVSSVYMNKALYDAYNAGVLCLNVDSSVSSFLSSSLFDTFLPSLGELTQGQTVPMLIALRPKNPPTIVVGEGTTQTVMGMLEPLDPLLTIGMKQLDLDFYAFIEQRYVRLFTLQTDLSLPLSLNFDPVAGTVTPALGSLTMALTNTTASNNKMLAENPSILANLLPSVIGLVQPLLGGILGPIALPTFDGLKLGVDSARGAVPVVGGQGYQHLVLYASISVAPAMMDSTRVHTAAKIVSSFVPTKAQLNSPEHPTPYAVIQASSSGPRPLGFQGYEYAYRVDGGLWSPWFRTEQFQINAPVLLLQGMHTIEITSEEIGLPATRDSSTASLQFPVDYEPPKVQFRVNSLTQELETVASDVVWHDALTYRYSLDGGSWTSAGPAQTFTLASLQGRSSVEVEVTNGSGLTSTATYGASPAAKAANTKAALAQAKAAGSGGGSGGCTEAGAPAFAAFLVAWLFVLRRRRA